MYKFRIKFILSESDYFNVDKTKVVINSLSRSYVLTSSVKDKKISESSVLELSGTGFELEAEAYQIGKHLIEVLRICSIRMGVGLSFGNEKSGSISKYLAESIYEETGLLTLNDVNGLMVFEETPNTVFVATSAYGVFLKDINRFQEEFQKLHGVSISLTKNLIDALELFNLTQFNLQPRIKFLLYIITIESLTEAKENRFDVVNHVNTLIDLTQTNTTLNDYEKQALMSSLNHLKKESISSSGRRLVSQYLPNEKYNGNQASKFFTKCYGIRSKLVHEGEWKFEYESITNELGRLVRELLLKIVEIDCIKS